MGPHWPRRSPRQIDFKSIFWENKREDPFYEVLVTGQGGSLWDIHSVLSDWKVIRAIKPSKRLPPWLAVGLNLSFNDDPSEHEDPMEPGIARVAEIRGSWVLLVDTKEKDPQAEDLFPNFLGIYKADELLESFTPRLTRLERAAFLEV